MNTNSLIQINLMMLQNQLNTPIVYDTSTDRFYFIKEQGDNLLYYDISNETDEVHFDLPKENLIFAPSINLPTTLTELNGAKRTLNGIPTDSKRTANGKTNEVQTETNGVLTNTKQPTIEKLTSRKRQKIAKHYRLADFSKLYEGYLNEVSKEIFTLTTEILQTKTQNVIDDTLKLYEKARTHAKKAQPTDINELRKIKKELTTKKNRQKGIKKGENKYTEKQQRKLKVKIVLVVFIVAFIGLFLLNKLTSRKDTIKAQSTEIVLTEPIITTAINEYENANNTFDCKRLEITIKQ